MGGGGVNFVHSSDGYFCYYSGIRINFFILEMFWSFLRFRRYFGHSSGFRVFFIILEVSSSNF